MGWIATVFGFFAGPIGKMALWGVGALVGIGALTAVYFSFVHQIEGRVLAEQRVTQLEQTVKDQDNTIQRQKALMLLQAATSKKLDEEIEKLNDNASTVTEWITSPEALESDRPSSLILRNTIKKLGVSK